MLVVADPIAATTDADVADESERLISDGPPPPRPKRRRWTRWIVGGGVLIGLFFTFLVPTMCAPRESAQRIKCSANLRQIGIAAMAFANAHHGVLPVSWQELASGSDVTSDVFICPSSDNTDRAVDTKAATWAASLDDAAAHHCSYCYAGQGLQSAGLTGEDIIAFEPESNHSGDGVNLLFADGHVDWHSSRAESKPGYERLMADYAAGVRPLLWRP